MRSNFFLEKASSYLKLHILAGVLGARCSTLAISIADAEYRRVSGDGRRGYGGQGNG